MQGTQWQGREMGFAPLKPVGKTGAGSEPWREDWRGLDSCCSAGTARGFPQGAEGGGWLAAGQSLNMQDTETSVVLSYPLTSGFSLVSTSPW